MATCKSSVKTTKKKLDLLIVNRCAWYKGTKVHSKKSLKRVPVRWNSMMLIAAEEVEGYE